MQGVGSAFTSVAGMGMLAEKYPDDRERGNRPSPCRQTATRVLGRRAVVDVVRARSEGPRRGLNVAARAR